MERVQAGRTAAFLGAAVVSWSLWSGHQLTDLRAQQLPQRTASQVSGVVRDMRTREPVPDATVVLRPVGVLPRDLGSSAARQQSHQVITSANGTFKFQGIGPGRYFLSARKTGYARGEFGVEKSGDALQFFDVRAGEDAVGNLWMPAAGVISGMVRTAAGKPIVGKRIRLIEMNTGSDGMPVLNYVARGTVLTDQRGEFRLADLVPGRYLVEASDNSATALGQFLNFAVNLDRTFMFFSGARSPLDAVPVDVGPGDERVGIDFVVPDTPPPALRISGRVEGVPFSVADQVIRLVSTRQAEGFPAFPEIASTAIRSDGSFDFPYVPPGQYEIRGLLIPGFLRGAGAAGSFPDPLSSPTPIEAPGHPPAHWIRQSIAVSESTSNVILTPSAGSRVRGRLQLSPPIPEFDWRHVPIRAVALDGWRLDGLPFGRVERDGRFTSAPLPPGSFLITAGRVGESLTVDSVEFRGREVLASGIPVNQLDQDGVVITMTNARTLVVGSVRDKAGKERPDSRVIYFRVNGAWRDGLFTPPEGRDVGSVRADRFAGYELLLAPGDYFVAAVVEGTMPSAWRTTSFLQSLLPVASKVSLTRGMRQTTDLIVQTVRK